MLAAVIVAALSVGASGAAFSVQSSRGDHAGTKGAASPAVAPAAPKVQHEAPPSPVFAEAPEAPPHAASTSHAAVSPALPAGPGHTKAGPAAPAASSSGKVPPALASAPVPAASASVPAVGAVSPAPAASDTAAAPPAPPAAPASAPAAAAPAPDGPAPSAAPAAGEEGAGDFDAEKAYVEIGIINAQGTNEKAVRAAIHGLQFSACYKMALRAKGARSTGVATLSLSFDEGGTARSAVMTGGDFLPGLARCVQDTATGVQVKGHVDPGGGGAGITLAFREP